MAFFRGLFLLLLLGVIVLFGLYMGTGDPRFKRAGLLTLKWVMVVAFGFFAGLILQRIFT